MVTVTNSYKSLILFFVFKSGTHHKQKNCDPQSLVAKLRDVYESKKSEYFPKSLELSKVDTILRIIKKSNGGWADPRDHRLCMSFAKSSDEKKNLTANILLL